MRKGLTLSLAVLMSLQTVAYAKVDRTEGMADAAISQAKINVKRLGGDIVAIRAQLRGAMRQIERRDSIQSQGIVVGLAAAGAAAALTGALLTRSSGAAAAGVGYSLLTSSLFLGLTSAVMDNFAHPADIDSINDTIDLLQQKALADSKTATDEKEKARLSGLASSAAELKVTMEKYKAGQDKSAATEVYASALKMGGFATFVVGATTGGSFFINGGATAVTLGNLATVISYAQQEDADKVIAEIKDVEKTLTELIIE